jgi:hypothetical protein
LKILIVEQDIRVLLELVALNQVLSLQRFTGLGILCDHPDAIASIRIDQVEADAAAVMLGAVKPHRAGDESKAKVTAPNRTLRHRFFLLRERRHERLNAR